MSRANIFFLGLCSETLRLAFKGSQMKPKNARLGHATHHKPIVISDNTTHECLGTDKTIKKLFIVQGKNKLLHGILYAF